VKTSSRSKLVEKSEQLKEGTPLIIEFTLFSSEKIPGHRILYPLAKTLVLNQKNRKALKVVSSDPPSELETAKSDFEKGTGVPEGSS
jgi:hypothetical protein